LERQTYARQDIHPYVRAVVGKANSRGITPLISVDELLNGETFYILIEAKVLIEQWLKE